ncbi:hypothetical protein BAE44_0010438 [Dichanthelium oligosanthes]|uniref:ZCF37 n=1 Tax=Dichanthelium oligosanthes TaxID=888268 RepID=A0A1E5VTU9_9POAL|nr:hypothetical protein BAE44_0010438 [Dichanthelium oligosanthes]
MFCECGTGSFKHVDEDPAEDLGCAGRSPGAGVRRKHGGGKVNPYAGRGLDRFSVVLSELEAQRAKILRRVGDSDTGLVLVRFVQSNGGWTPVVVKLSEEPLKRGAAAAKKRKAASNATPTSLPPTPASPASPPDPASPREREAGVKKQATTTKVPARRASFSWGRRMRRPSGYWPAVVVLTLVSLAVFGRVFAICLTSIWWYVLPTLPLGNGCSDGVVEDARRAGLRLSMEKRKLVSPPPHAKKGSSCGVLYEVASSPRGHAKGKRG